MQFKQSLEFERGTCDHPHRPSHVGRDPGGHLACAEHKSHFNMELDDIFIDENTATYRKSSAKFYRLPPEIHMYDVILD